MNQFYGGRRVLVTGGLGFIGSNLALALNRLGARVRVVDARVPGCGANPHNLAPARGAIEVLEADIGDARAISPFLEDVEIVFNLAGEISHTGSMRNPGRDLGLNVTAQLGFLETCARELPGVRVVYASTRQVYGQPAYLPVDEAHPIQPVDFNGIHKHAAAQYHVLLTQLGRLDAIVLRFTNVYGPRLAIHLRTQGFLPAFFQCALQGRPLLVYGDGRQRRDPVFVDDCVEALLRAGTLSKPAHRIFNIGHRTSHAVGEIAEKISRLAGLPGPALTPFPQDRRIIDIGDYVTDVRLAASELGWTATTPLEDGLVRSLDFFREMRDVYLPYSSDEPQRVRPYCPA